MKPEERKKFEEKRIAINLEAKKIKKELEEAENDGDWERADKLDKELDTLRRKQKYVLWKLGKYKYQDDEAVEFEPGQFMDAEHYNWLME